MLPFYYFVASTFAFLDYNNTYFLAELFTTAMFFNWKGARTKSHEK